MLLLTDDTIDSIYLLKISSGSKYTPRSLTNSGLLRIMFEKCYTKDISLL